jgi:glycosyltransferase involved in cell wall biosynthesis
MDYTIDEVAALPEPRPLLVLLGNIDEASPPVLRRGQERLGAENFVARSVNYEEVPPYYQAADVFALASLREGFGRVYLEALIAGLPCVAHDNEVTRYVTAGQAVLCDLASDGAMTEPLYRLLKGPAQPDEAARRREAVRQCFSWEVLCPKYIEMFYRCAASTTKGMTG